jgi:hypothetical protein
MSFATILACFPSKSIDVRRVFKLTGQASRVARTINDHLDLVTYFLNLTVYDSDSVTDAMCDSEHLCMRHPSLLLRKPIKFLERILQINHTGQFPQKLLYALFSEALFTANPKLTC